MAAVLKFGLLLAEDLMVASIPELLVIGKESFRPFLEWLLWDRDRNLLGAYGKRGVVESRRHSLRAGDVGVEGWGDDIEALLFFVLPRNQDDNVEHLPVELLSLSLSTSLHTKVEALLLSAVHLGVSMSPKQVWMAQFRIKARSAFKGYPTT